MRITEKDLRYIIRDEFRSILLESEASTPEKEKTDPSATFEMIRKRWSDRAFPKIDNNNPNFVNEFVRNMMDIFKSPNSSGYFKILEHLFSYRFIPGNEFWFGSNLNAFLARAALYRLDQLQKKGATSQPEVALSEVLKLTDESMTKDPAGIQALNLAKKMGVKISPSSLLSFTFASGGFPGEYLAVWDEARKKIA